MNIVPGIGYRYRQDWYKTNNQYPLLIKLITVSSPEKTSKNVIW